MKLGYYCILSVFILSTLTACKEDFIKGKDIQIEKAIFKESHGIKRNNDKPWKSNQPTIDGIQKMTNHINNFELRNDFKAYSNLKKILEDEIITIFSKCTMKGEAHDELHNYLLPLHDMLKTLDSKDVDTCKDQVKKIKYQLSIYPVYFN